MRRRPRELERNGSVSHSFAHSLDCGCGAIVHPAPTTHRSVTCADGGFWITTSSEYTLSVFSPRERSYDPARAARPAAQPRIRPRSEEHTSELQSRRDL